MEKVIKKLLSFMLIVSMLMFMNVTTLASEIHKTLSNINSYSSDIIMPIEENINKMTKDILNKDISDSFIYDEKISLNSAGLAWGPVKIGNIELKITNPHIGYVPGIGNVNHINFHITKTSNGRDIANYHIVKYSSGDSICLYVYESVSKKVVIDNCYKNWTSAVGDIVEVIKNVVKVALSEADWIATVTIWGTIAIVIADLIIPMDPVPIIPFSLEPVFVKY